MKKYKDLYYSFVELEHGYHHQFSEEEDTTSCKVWRVNAMTKGIDTAYEIVQKEREGEKYKQFYVKQITNVFYDKDNYPQMKEGSLWVFSTTKDYDRIVWELSLDSYPTLELAYERLIQSFIDDASRKQLYQFTQIRLI